MIWDSGPFDNDWAFTEFGLVVWLIADRIDAEVKELNDKPLQAEQAVVAMVCCLRVMGKVCPKSMSSALEPSRIEAWQEAFNKWYEAVKKKLPAKHREAIRTVADKEFAQLLKHW